MNVLIVADDLTGAVDSAVAFVRRGRTVRVARRIEDLPEVAGSAADVVCVNTASREVSKATAVARIEAVAEIVDLPSVALLMKKVDSRLKGHVGAETDALARLAGRRKVVAAPAIPDMGRRQEGGFVVGSGIDAPIPISERFGRDVLAPDIRTDTDLASVVAGRDGRTLWAGARGLAFALAADAFGVEDVGRMDLPTPVLMALGSRDPITVRQVQALEGQCHVWAAPNGAVPDHVDSSEMVAVAISPGQEDVPPAVAMGSFAEGIARIATGMKPRSLLVGGGETADALLDRLGIGRLTVLAEVAPGVPVSSVEAPWGALLIATKSGGFGAPDLLRGVVARTPRTPRRLRNDT